MAGRTAATCLAATLVGVLVPGIALLSARGAPTGTVTLGSSPATEPAAPVSRQPTNTVAGVVDPTPASSAISNTTTTSIEPVPTTSPPTVTPPPTLAEPIVTHGADIRRLAPRDVAAPVRVLIPSLAVDGPVLPAGVNSMQELDVPPDAGTLVWYRHGPVPGDAGSAVIAGHLNWRGEQGVFANLAAVAVGEVFTVVYEDGSQRAFAVRTVELVPKPAVAVNGVFARRGERLLRLVTCGGEFDDSTNHYRSNVVVTAAPV